MSSQTSWSPPPPWLWLKCNRLLKLGRPVGAVTLSRWEWWCNERWIWGARGALNLISTNYPDHGHHGRLPFSRKNANGRAGNRTRDLMVSSQELWPPNHEGGHYFAITMNIHTAGETRRKKSQDFYSHTASSVVFLTQTFQIRCLWVDVTIVNHRCHFFHSSYGHDKYKPNLQTLL